MQTKYNKFTRFALNTLLLCAIGVGLFFTSCEKDDDDKSSSKIELFSYGPMPVARGGELRFIGNNLDKVTAIVIPDGIEIPASSFTKRTSSLLTLTVTQEAVESYVVLKTPQGNIETKTPIGYSEPISIASFTPATIKPGAQLTITGDYLNLVGEVIFTDRVVVDADDFVSQTRTEIKLVVPAEAQTGKIAVSDGKEDPNIVYSESVLTVTLPAFSTIAPNPVKAGQTLTITGTNLDLTKKVVLGGNKVITTFGTHTATQIVLTVPNDTKDGKVKMIPASEVEVESEATLIMVVPTVSVAPTTVKNGGQITVTGENLDLISQVVFGGNKNGTIVAGGTATEIIVNIPNDAVDGVVNFRTLADKSVEGPALTFVKPVISGVTPLSGKPNTSVTINGTDLDLVAEVIFTGGIKGTITTKTETQIIATVPVGAQTGKITLKTVNGTEVQSASPYEVLTNLPNITGYSESTAVPGKILTINGTSLSLIKEMIFPGNIYATAYGLKTDTKVEVYVPKNVPFGFGQITMITYEGEEGLTPSIFFGGTDPIVYPALVYNDFDESGHSLDWDNWDGISLLMNDGTGVSGKYLKGNAQLDAWAWKFVWGCNHDQLPKPSLANAANYVLKVDVRITGNVSNDANRFQFKINGKDSNWTPIGLQNSDGTWSTNGSWVTVTFDLATDLNITGAIGSGGDWGLVVQPAAALDLTKFSFDNFRFEPKP